MLHSIVYLICALIAPTLGFRSQPPQPPSLNPAHLREEEEEGAVHELDKQSKLRVFLAGLSNATDKTRCDNFRHQADTIATYGLLRNRSVPANAITIVYGGSQNDCHDLMSIKTRTATKKKEHVEVFTRRYREDHRHWSDEEVAAAAEKIAEANAKAPKWWWRSWMNYEEGLRQLDADLLAEDGEKPHVVTGSNVTVDNVLKALRQSVQSEHDDLFIYIATHGSAPLRTDGAKAGTLQVATPHHSGQVFKNYLPAPLLLQTIGELPARRTFVFTQVCFSGAMWAAPNPPMGKNGVVSNVFGSTSVDDGFRCQAFSGSYTYGVNRPPCERPDEMSEAELDDCYWTSKPIQPQNPQPIPIARSNTEPESSEVPDVVPLRRSKTEESSEQQYPGRSRAERLKARRSIAEDIKKFNRVVEQNVYAKAYTKAFQAFNPPKTKDIVAFSAAPWHLEAAGGLGVGQIPSYSSTASASFQRWLLANPCPNSTSSSTDDMKDLFTFINKQAKKDQPGCGFETSGITGQGSMTWFGKAMSSLPVFAFTCPLEVARDKQILSLTSDIDHADQIFRAPHEDGGLGGHLLDTPADGKAMNLPYLLPNSNSIRLDLPTIS